MVVFFKEILFIFIFFIFLEFVMGKKLELEYFFDLCMWWVWGRMGDILGGGSVEVEEEDGSVDFECMGGMVCSVGCVVFCSFLL